VLLREWQGVQVLADHLDAGGDRLGDPGERPVLNARVITSVSVGMGQVAEDP
jgi:hypothetical protein